MANELESRFAAEVAKLEKRIRDLEKGTRSPQLGNASLDLDSSRGYIPIRQNGVERGRIGRQPDGSVTFTSVNSPVAPNVPVPIQVEPTLSGVRVTVYGIVGEQPHDFSHVKVYCDGLVSGTISALPGSLVIAPLSYVNHTFWATAVNLSGKESVQTASVIVTPKKAVSDDITNGIIDELKMADASVTEAKIATSAITAPKLAAAAVVAEAIAANAVIAGKIAAGTVTAVEIAALTIQAGNIAADAIAAGKIAADAISAREIQALAITADKLAANSVLAGSIAAGSVTADKLAAELLLASRIIVGPEDDWHLEINESNSPLMYWNNQDIGFALTRDETTSKSSVYISGRMEFGDGSQIDSDIIDLQELPSTGWQDPKARQSRVWVQSALSTSITPYYVSPTMKGNLIFLSVWQLGDGSAPTCSTPINSQLIYSSTNGNTRLSTFMIQNPAASRTFENFTSNVNSRWAITLTEFQGTLLPTSFNVNAFNSSIGSTSMNPGSITPTDPNTLQISVFGAASGHVNKDNFGSAINGFNKQLGSGSANGFGTALYTKKASTAGTSTTTVNIPNSRWSGQIVSFVLAPASTIPPAPNTDKTIRWYTRKVNGIAAPHVIQSNGATYPVTKGPHCRVYLTVDVSISASLDVFAQGDWAASVDPYNMVAISTTPGSFSSITIPITGLYYIDFKAIYQNSINTTDTAAAFVTKNARLPENSIARANDKFVDKGGGGTHVHATRTVILNVNDVLYWGNWASVNAQVTAGRINIPTEITVTYLGPGV